MNDANTVTPPRTYGGWYQPLSAGYGKLTLAQTGIAVGLLSAVVLTYAIAGLWAALVPLAVLGLFLIMVWNRDKHGWTIAMKVSDRMKFTRARTRGLTTYASGPINPRTTDTACKLPGIASKIRVGEYQDAYMRPFSLIKHPSGTFAVVIGLYPDGGALVDQETVDVQVARWGLWIASLSEETGIVGASITVESVPDRGERLEREVSSRIAPDAPQFARQVMRDVVEDYRQGTAQIRAWATVTMSPSALGIKADMDEMAQEFGARLPELTHGLIDTGGGAVHVVGYQELCRIIRVAYDPASEAIFERAAAAREHVDIDFSAVGPIAAHATWDAYQHDSGISRSWVLTGAPGGQIQSGVLRRILAPSKDVDRKRVTILYRPIPSGDAPDVAQKDLNAAIAGSGNRASVAHSAARKRLAEKVAEEEASGASIVDFGMIVTATTQDGDIKQVGRAVEALAGGSRLRLRTSYGSQQSAFALGLPLGLRPPHDNR